ncbi:MAG: sigma-70 family RNA polymerase sigma factor [Bacteroidota bacterium]
MEQTGSKEVQPSGAQGVGKPLTAFSDEELIAEFQKGNETAFNLIVGRFKNPLTNFVYRFVGDWDDSNDVVQETLVRVYRNKHSYKPVARFSTWIYTIATNLAKTQLRRRKRRGVLFWGGSEDENKDVLFDVPDEESRTDQRVESSLQEERIQKALDALPVKYKEVIVLRDVQELSYEEVAEITKLNIGTVKSRINRGRSQLQEMLKDIWND